MASSPAAHNHTPALLLMQVCRTLSSSKAFGLALVRRALMEYRRGQYLPVTNTRPVALSYAMPAFVARFSSCRGHLSHSPSSKHVCLHCEAYGYLRTEAVLVTFFIAIRHAACHHGRVYRKHSLTVQDVHGVGLGKVLCFQIVRQAAQRDPAPA